MKTSFPRSTSFVFILFCALLYSHPTAKTKYERLSENPTQKIIAFIPLWESAWSCQAFFSSYAFDCLPDPSLSPSFRSPVSAGPCYIPAQLPEKNDLLREFQFLIHLNSCSPALQWKICPVPSKQRACLPLHLFLSFGVDVPLLLTPKKSRHRKALILKKRAFRALLDLISTPLWLISWLKTKFLD